MEKLEVKSVKAIAAVVILIWGRYLISRLVSSANNKAQDPEDISSPDRTWLECASGNIYYTETDGAQDLPVLVFIHGLNSSSQQWYYQRLFFRERYRLVFIDLPGHGKSKKAKDLSIATLATDIRSILDFLNIKDAVLYGHSMGGNVVLEYCHQNLAPENIRGIIVHQSSYTNPLETCAGSSLLLRLQKPVIIPLLQIIKRYQYLFWAASIVNYLNGLSSLFFRYSFFTGKQSAAQLLFISRIAISCSPFTTAEGLLSLMRFESRSYLNRISVPALIIAGKDDRLVKPEASSYLSRQMTNAQLKLMKEGHQDLIENYEELNATLLAFISSVEEMKD